MQQGGGGGEEVAVMMRPEVGVRREEVRNELIRIQPRASQISVIYVRAPLPIVQPPGVTAFTGYVREGGKREGKREGGRRRGGHHTSATFPAACKQLEPSLISSLPS